MATVLSKVPHSCQMKQTCLVSSYPDLHNKATPTSSLAIWSVLGLETRGLSETPKELSQSRSLVIPS